MSSSLSGLAAPTLSTAATGAANSAAQTGLGTAAASSLSQLGGNYSDFLKLLMTQLQNQDPTSPMDTAQFTSELVQFSSVEQQINTNSNLTSLIQLTQSSDMLQSTALVGHQVALNIATMPVQNGGGEIQFSPAGAGPVTITVSNSQGTTLTQQTVDATAGTNTWHWNARSSSGVAEPDGVYTVTATTQSGSGPLTAVPFTVIGTATGVTKSGTTINLQVGALSTSMTNVASVIN